MKQIVQKISAISLSLAAGVIMTTMFDILLTKISEPLPVWEEFFLVTVISLTATAMVIATWVMCMNKKNWTLGASFATTMIATILISEGELLSTTTVQIMTTVAIIAIFGLWYSHQSDYQ